MGYYQGDYYRGDFYQGDPGVLGFLGRAGRTIAGMGASMLPGVGGLAGRLISRIPGGGRGVQIIKSAGAAVIKHPVLSGAAAAGVVGATAVGVGAPGAGAMTMPGGALMGPVPMGPGAMMPGMRGFHMSKPRRINPASGIPHLVRNRRMRVTNPRALRRAIRRAKGFERLARRCMHFVSPRAPKGRAIFKTRRRRK